MYLTAHRVKSHDEAATGVNVFFHLHGVKDPFASSLGDQELLRLVTESEPGRLVGQWTDLKPGGNTVLSYLDVIAPDGTRGSVLEQALDDLRGALPAEEAQPSLRSHGKVVVAFGAAFGLRGAARLREFDELRLALQTHLAALDG
jgi:hypothetical protein